MRLFPVPVALMLLSLVACGPEKDPVTTDTSSGGADTADTSVTDTSVTDTSVDSADTSGGDTATDTSSGDTGSDTGPNRDEDGDGYTIGEGDCNDADPAVNPGAREIPDNRVDEDCDGTVGVTPAAASFASDVLPIFQANCTYGCHSGDRPSAQLDLGSRANIVNVASRQRGTMRLVAPGDTANSYLIYKINGTHLDVGGSGQRMPSRPLAAGDIATIEGWVTDGAAE